MTDRELLQAAARAAGINGGFENDGAEAGLFLAIEPAFSRGSWIRWNPLTDDGDALRLAVKLGLMVDANTHAASSGGGKFFAQAGERDGFAATRRAIVRAAAALDAGRMDGEKAP